LFETECAADPKELKKCSVEGGGTMQKALVKYNVGPKCANNNTLKGLIDW